MKAAYLLDHEIIVGDIPDPDPAPGQVLVRTQLCAICASDYHLVHHGERLVKWSAEHNGPFRMDLSRPVVLGHEFVAEIVAYGPGTDRNFRAGTRVTSLLGIPDGAGGRSIVGLSNDYPGGFGEYMLLSADLMRAVPDSVDTRVAALAEPLSVGLHHARYGRPEKGEVSLVIGCGAIGLGVIAGLRLMGTGPIVAADYEPGRRQLAARMGADIVIDPAAESPYRDLAGLHGQQPSVIYECVGVPGVTDQILQDAAAGARIVSGGWCLEPDFMFTPSAHLKRLTIMFAGGEEQQDFDLALAAIEDGRIDVTAWLGPTAGLSGVWDALEGLGNPKNPIRVLIDPRLP
jgi:threonine dehydrogenase-like Zn-dependent dehydrogenase